MFAVYEESYGLNLRNYQTLVRSGTKVVLLEGGCEESVVENLRASRRRSKCVYEVVVSHGKLRNFLNKVIPVHSHALFAFIVEKVQRENVSVWDLELLLEWRNHLLQQGRGSEEEPAQTSQ